MTRSRELYIRLSFGLLGLVIGTAAGVLVVDGGFGPDSPTTARLETAAPSQAAAAATSRDTAVATAARLKDSQADVARLEQETAKLQKTLDRRQRTIGRLEAKLQARGKQPVSPPASSPTPGPSAGDGNQHVTGTLKTTWVLTSQLKPWPNDCSGAQKSYQVRVNNGAHATLTIASITASRVSGRTVRTGILSLTCLLTYSTDIPKPLSSVYEFVAVSASEPEKSLKSALVQAGSLSDETGPDLYVSFCPEC